MQIVSNDSRADEGEFALHRIGAVSRLSGVPVTTLRVWESRYEAFAPAKTAGRHRLYRDADVIKARLLRQLSASGLGVGGIAHLANLQLQKMLNANGGSPEAVKSPSAFQTVATVIIGAAIAARVDAPAWRQNEPQALLNVRQVFADLDEAAASAGALPAGSEDEAVMLLVRMNTVNSRSHAQLTGVIRSLRAHAVIVLYSYGPQAVVDALRSAGLWVRREPVPDAELKELIRSACQLEDVADTAASNVGQPTPRKYSDSTLARVAASASGVLCECPRHLAEILSQLTSFEDYSAQCLNDSVEDAQLHGYLRSVAGTARVMFEQALQKAALHGGLLLTEDSLSAPQS